MRKRYSTEFICLCTECEAITTGIAVEISAQTRYDPAEWENRCECGSEEFYDLEYEFNHKLAPVLKSEWENLEDHKDYEVRYEAKGYLKAIADIIEGK